MPRSPDVNPATPDAIHANRNGLPFGIEPTSVKNSNIPYSTNDKIGPPINHVPQRTSNTTKNGLINVSSTEGIQLLIHLSVTITKNPANAKWKILPSSPPKTIG
ncbi:hypothetical protein FQA39_LY12992 [Lamprigera yunnana]|nr:hypothetical protein FQA39_LY12992 [Lamprigera yunnana]